MAIGYPRLIRSDWAGLPNDIDAAFTWTNGRTYFFKVSLKDSSAGASSNRIIQGSKYWRFTNFKADAEYPKELSEGFAGVPSNVDTAFVWSGNGKIYFFKGSKYWRFDPTQKPPIKSTYPKDISNWEGLPNDLDAAFQFTNGYSYFFKNGLYWRFNDRSFKVHNLRKSHSSRSHTKQWNFHNWRNFTGTIHSANSTHILNGGSSKWMKISLEQSAADFFPLVY